MWFDNLCDFIIRWIIMEHSTFSMKFFQAGACIIFKFIYLRGKFVSVTFFTEISTHFH